MRDETAENEELDRKGSPVCVYGDMDLQDRANVGEFIGVEPQLKMIPSKGNDYNNQILGYLLGFTPKLDVEEQESGWDKFTNN